MILGQEVEMRQQKMHFYNDIADSFEEIANPYDTDRRREVIFNDFLGRVDLQGKRLLDAGCGFGAFSATAVARGAEVTAVDIAERLVAKVREKVPGIYQALTGSILGLPFPDASFDIVVSSDVIEHTEDVWKAVGELIRVLKPGGLLCLTVPNRSFWFFSVIIANRLGLRKYKGLENWVHYSELHKRLRASGMDILEYKGIHSFPFVIPFLNDFLRACDRVLEKRCGVVMVNIACLARKQQPL